MMDEEMKDLEGEVFTVHEIDLDYEFDACKYLDFCKEETFANAREAEMWFDFAPDYPPSPFVAKLVLGDMSFLGNVNVSPKAGIVENSSSCKYQASFGHSEMSNLDAAAGGLTFYNHMAKDGAKDKPKPRRKAVSRNSTLMKPTASQLAKQNKAVNNFSSRVNMFQTSDNKSSNNSSGIESQAPKRQKLEGGQLHKIVDVKQQSPLVYKALRKDGILDVNSNAKLKFTIPKEPAFETRQRVQPVRCRTRNILKPEQGAPDAYSFRAWPLNRKILQAPSMPLLKKSTPRPPEFQEFHLKTAERSAQHMPAVPSSSSHCDKIHKTPLTRPSLYPFTPVKANNTNERPNSKGAVLQEECGKMHTFKARPLNKKIFSSKGDIGVSRSIKRNVTIPREFKFETEKRVLQNPPVDLFSKLSLTSELQPTNGNEKKLSRLTFIPTKGSKENRGASSQREHEIKSVGRDKTPRFWPDQLHCGSHAIAVETGSQAGRWLGIR